MKRKKLTIKQQREAARSIQLDLKKWRAVSTASNARRKGWLRTTPCVNCGEIKVNGHHHDYDRPLSVIWLCRPCHMKLHYRKDIKEITEILLIRRKILKKISIRFKRLY